MPNFSGRGANEVFMNARQAGMYNDRIVGQDEVNLPLEKITIPTITSTVRTMA